jgi:DNA-binding TFAR19-related protein (PDSD5 family)
MSNHQRILLFYGDPMPGVRRKTIRQPREDYQKKKARKGLKSMRGQPETEYGELKKIVSLSMTPSALKGLDRISRELQISRSELVERIGRQLIKLEVGGVN